MVEFILHRMLHSRTYLEGRRRLTCQHLSGHGNVHSDLVSRGLWEAFFALCAQMGIRPQRIELTPEASALVWDTVEFARSGGLEAPPARRLRRRLGASRRSWRCGSDAVDSQRAATFRNTHICGRTQVTRGPRYWLLATVQYCSPRHRFGSRLVEACSFELIKLGSK